MGSRSPHFWFVAPALTIALTAALSWLFIPMPLAAVELPAPGAWLRPVPGAVARPFVAPLSRYGAGHRGADLVAPSGTPVRAANAGEVSFAGRVAGSLHVVIAHAGGLRTSYSFLATVAVRRGQRITRGDVIGTAGGGVDDHAGVLHLGLRVGDRYVDPMALFSPTDLTRLIRLVPVDEPDQHGLDPPALESRSLAESLHLPVGLPGVEPEPEPGVLARVSGALGELGAAVSRFTVPERAPFEQIGGGVGGWWKGSGAPALVADVRNIAGRLLAWARSRAHCVTDTAPPPGGGGSGHTVMAVAGINSSTDPKTGATFPLDTDRLGYRRGEVRYFSYAPDGGAYRAAQTTGDLRQAASALHDQLRELQQQHPGREVDLIGHSQGGVVIAAFLAHYDPGDPTLPPLGTVITLSSPLRGAPVATAVRGIRGTASGRAALDAVDRRIAGALPPTSGRATAQLAEDSPFMRRLAATPWPGQIDATTIAAVDDTTVPADHATFPQAPTATVNPPGPSDHSAVVNDPAALDVARLALEHRPLPCISVVEGVRGAVEPVVISRAERSVGELGRAAAQITDTLSAPFRQAPEGTDPTTDRHSPSGELKRAGSR
jgi:hypothetical protein